MSISIYRRETPIFLGTTAQVVSAFSEIAREGNSQLQAIFAMPALFEQQVPDELLRQISQEATGLLEQKTNLSQPTLQVLQALSDGIYKEVQARQGSAPAPKRVTKTPLQR